MEKNRLKVALPLAAAALLAVFFVILLFRQALDYGESNSSATAGDAGATAEEEISPLAARKRVIPTGPPTAPDPYATHERPRHGGEFFRWNLEELPEGWNGAIARRIHDLIERMDRGGVEMRSPEAQKMAEARKELIEYLASLGPEALPTLGAILNAEPFFVSRRLVFQAIGNLGPRSEEATWILRDYYYSRREDPKNGSEIKRLIEAMGFLRNDTSFEVLSYLAGNGEPSHRRYRDSFVMALGEHPRREEAINVFADGMHDQSFQTRNKSAQALGKIRSPDTLGELYNAFERERIFYAKQTILGSIGKIGEPASIPFLEEHARGARESGVRLSAANAIRRIVQQTGNASGRQALEGLGRTEPDPAVRKLIQDWIGKL